MAETGFSQVGVRIEAETVKVDAFTQSNFTPPQ